MLGKIAVLILVLVQSELTVQDFMTKVPNGKVLGREDVTAAKTKYYSFEGIPYGAPPVGTLRFQAPKPAPRWQGVLNATFSDTVCYSFPPKNDVGIEGMPSENCLLLNVYTTNLPVPDDDAFLPVMVWIYGGAFIGGTAFDYPPDLFMDHGVVLVSINYRSGIFGFLSTSDEVIPGNAGLKDQALALQWVHDNIEYFGGDNTKVTIFGQGSGAGSAAYQLLNQNALYLINGAILESGTFLSPAMFQPDPRPKAFGTAAILNSTFATSDDSQALLEFLLHVHPKTLNEAAIKYVKDTTEEWDSFIALGSKFGPVIEVRNPEGFLTKKQYSLIQDGNILPVPTLMGFTSEEKLGAFQDGKAFKKLVATIDEQLDFIVPDDMQTFEPNKLAELATKMRNIYTGGTTFSKNLAGAVRFSSDNFLVRPMLKHAEIFSSIAPTYFYQFSFEGGLDYFNVRYRGAGGVGHGAELEYLFCSDVECPNVPKADWLTRQRLIKLWTNFAKHQNPTPEPEGLLQNVTWPEVSAEDGDLFYLDINKNLKVKNHPKKEAFKKWVELYDGLGHDDFDTY